ncbi:hypothetical protein G3A56_01705 [Rhizobium oryzihabitans]|uniref:Uncharacterized protein n=1 Tax=Rhizobium oryzihabitans TaxID=2267833 RepID=A0A7L5BDB5_9HYPH|nr:hypothetical protein [Rhizobium oryzihabitans]QIB36868.1 hypothetical protein G3A56_01705 [Rhizobium oryzihabitans]
MAIAPCPAAVLFWMQAWVTLGANLSDEARADALEKASIDASVEGLKALLILNGGACIALLAFLSATMGKEHTIKKEAAFVLGATEALVFFAAGAFLAVVTCVFAYLANQAYSSHLRDRNYYARYWGYGTAWTRAALVTTVLSLGGFGWGVYTIYSHIYQ